jgi:hypothetical protein
MVMPVGNALVEHDAEAGAGIHARTSSAPRSRFEIGSLAPAEMPARIVAAQENHA